MTATQRFEHGGIRQAVRGDLLDIFRIEKTVFEQPWPFSAFERYLGEPGFLVAEGNSTADPTAGNAGAENIAGYTVCDTIPSHGRPLGHVKDLAVHPDRQGEGLGRALLERGLAVLAAQNVRSVKLEVRRSNQAALSLYRDHGFEYLRTLPRYYSDGEDAFVMICRLPNRD
ncbi:GNAT family N-acetyltransferase [Halocalculus aciditolerans]|uniref:Ribosomal-protein-alanine N-acetyltransferase n=1 Tax=Halocalculus aciditolerans TaxID=1383812 RepID=A0A830FPY6_9EURY|nr:GNAT family N-acetyltransferase [Halocalculus aciditolerans]GGL68837.1 ribosomal-protein-alanine N-acetyltransferase [Halocalculus aciditolerans]